MQILFSSNKYIQKRTQYIKYNYIQKYHSLILKKLYKTQTTSFNLSK